MADEIQQTDPPEQGPSAGPSSGPGSTASNLFQDSHPPSPSMQDTISGARGSSAHISEQSPPSPVANPAKGPEDLRADYETIHDMIHSAQRLLFEQRYLQAPTGDVIVGSRHMIRQYLPPGGPEEFTLNDYRAVLSVALQSVRAVFVEKEAERKEAAKKEAVETEALKKDALEKEALEKEALGKREALEKEALMQVSIGTAYVDTDVLPDNADSGGEP